jgi:hypothetical protein
MSIVGSRIVVINLTMDLQNNLVLNKNKMTAIIAVLDEQ